MKNVYCNTAKYELKSILKRDKENIHVFLQEFSALQSLQHKAGINKLMDVIEDDDSISLILQRKDCLTLSSVLEQHLIDSSEKRVEFARKTMIKLGKIIYSVHKKKVMHRSLNTDSIVMSQSGRTYKVSSVKDFDFSYHLQKHSMEQQGFATKKSNFLHHLESC